MYGHSLSFGRRCYKDAVSEKLVKQECSSGHNEPVSEDQTSLLSKTIVRQRSQVFCCRSFGVRQGGEHAPAVFVRVNHFIRSLENLVSRGVKFQFRCTTVTLTAPKP